MVVDHNYQNNMLFVADLVRKIEQSDETQVMYEDPN